MTPLLVCGKSLRIRSSRLAPAWHLAREASLHSSSASRAKRHTCARGSAQTLGPSKREAVDVQVSAQCSWQLLSALRCWQCRQTWPLRTASALQSCHSTTDQASPCLPTTNGRLEKASPFIVFEAKHFIFRILCARTGHLSREPMVRLPASLQASISRQRAYTAQAACSCWVASAMHWFMLPVTYLVCRQRTCCSHTCPPLGSDKPSGHSHVPGRRKWGLTLRSSRLAPAWHLAREAAPLILGLAGQAPRQRSWLSSNVRPRKPLMRTTKHRLATLLPLLLPLGAIADPLPPIAKTEIANVLSRLEASGCQFNRNGSWHTSSEARVHLQRKLDYVERKASVKSAEEYIALAASKSSTTGEAYQVKCGSQSSVASSVWLLQQLQEVRSSSQGRQSK